MSKPSIAEFEARATQAEKMIEVLTSRMEELEKKLSKGGSSTGGNGSLDQFKHSTLAELREVSSALEHDKKEADAVVEARDKAVLRLNELEAENKVLKTQNEKLQYRVKILVRSLEAEEKQHEADCTSLKTKTEKQEYRIQHLVKTLEAEEKKSATVN